MTDEMQNQIKEQRAKIKEGTASEKHKKQLLFLLDRLEAEHTTHTIRNTETGEEKTLTVAEILTEINRDRSDAWTPYNESDWQEGLDVFTEYKLI